MPEHEMSLPVECGVGYGSNLEKVEKVTLEVAKNTQKKVKGAVRSHTPSMRFTEFGDSNINFWVWLRAKDRLASFKVRSEVMKRMKANFDKEGITINDPMRHLSFVEETMPPAFRAGNQHSGKQDNKD